MTKEMIDELYSKEPCASDPMNCVINIGNTVSKDGKNWFVDIISKIDRPIPFVVI